MNGTRSQSLMDVELGFEPTSVQSMYPHCSSGASREGKGIEDGGGAAKHEGKEPGIWHTVGLQPGSRSAGREEMEVVGVGHSSETLAKNENWGIRTAWRHRRGFSEQPPRACFSPWEEEKEEALKRPWSVTARERPLQVEKS